ncbi:MAG: septation ring formation regulator EzrA [Culicoidibacterales bacterium]
MNFGNIDQRTLIIIAIVVGVVIALILFGVIMNALKKRRQEMDAKINDFETKRDELRTSSLESELAKLRLSEKGRVLTGKYTEWLNRFEEVTEQVTVDITNKITVFEDYIHENKYKMARELEPEITSNLQMALNEVEMIEAELKSYVEDDSKVRTRQVQIDMEYAEIAKSIDELILPAELKKETTRKQDEIEQYHEQILHHLEESEYELAKGVQKSFTTAVNDLEKMYSTYPKFVKILNETIVQPIDEVDRKYRVMKSDFIFDAYDMPEKITEFRSQYDELLELLKQMNLKQLDVLATEVSTEINEVISYLKIEEVNRNSVLKYVPELKKLVGDAQVKTKAIVSDWEDLQKFYDENAFEGKNVDRLEERLVDVENKFVDIEKQYKQSTVPFGTQKKAIENFVRDLHALNQYLTDFDLVIERLRKDENEAKLELNHLNQLYRHTVRKVERAHMPEVPKDFEANRDFSQQLLRDLEGELENLPINVERLNDTLEKCEAEVVKFYEDASKMVKTFNLSQKAMVFANRYRSTSQTIDSELTKAEFNFLNGYYGKSLEVTLSVIAQKDLKMYNKLVNYYEEKIIVSTTNDVEHEQEFENSEEQ